ncbi:MAG: glycerophosphodiester phosphodiesterase [Gammaproteobacteria bacterium]|nr:MAG: glycerophosphodiester phosphodiesterase [Gammaproteobacteria bacterium]TDJ36930.1 MAG: glycerophosphodiester phosphodiesterase [Gammaproteobacteria bacterium]
MSRKARNWVLILIVMMFIIVIRATTSSPIQPTAYFDVPQPMVIAHQGGDGLRPGNTLVAFQYAVELGVDVLEMDVHASSDGILVLMHDTTVDRTTNGTGPISELTLLNLKELDAGYHWPYSGDVWPYRDKGVNIPTLDEVLRRFPDMRFNIEIKQTEPSIAEELCAMLQQFGLGPRTLVAAYERAPIIEFRENCPNVATTAFDLEVVWFVAYQKLRLTKLYHPVAHAMQLPPESLGIDLTSSTFLAAANERGMHVDIWTVNDPGRMRLLIDKGVGGIITDRPDEMLAILGR